ncbi:hypothetical protein SAMN02910456_00068 [Ruminococcaceae bacterium YRB3002]|nr:hypothetical protein SAMN02910456_00068 [Ruminococcaceae bacterium YRB3002]
MRIEYNVQEPKSYYKEIISVAMSSKKLFKNPEYKVPKCFPQYIALTAAGAVVMAALFLLGIFRGFDVLIIIGIVVGALDVAVGLMLISIMFRTLKKLMSIDKTALIMDENGVAAENTGFAGSLKWEQVAFVREFDECICFFPKTMEDKIMVFAHKKSRNEIVGFLDDNRIQIKRYLK